MLLLIVFLAFLLAAEAASHRSRSLHRQVKREVPDWAYVGCVNDGSARALTGFQVNDSANTVDKCIATCAGRGFDYAGMQCESRSVPADRRRIAMFRKCLTNLAHVVR